MVTAQHYNIHLQQDASNKPAQFRSVLSCNYIEHDKVRQFRFFATAKNIQYLFRPLWIWHVEFFSETVSVRRYQLADICCTVSVRLLQYRDTSQLIAVRYLQSMRELQSLMRRQPLPAVHQTRRCRHPHRLLWWSRKDAALRQDALCHSTADELLPLLSLLEGHLDHVTSELLAVEGGDGGQRILVVGHRHEAVTLALLGGGVAHHPNGCHSSKGSEETPEDVIICVRR